MKVSAMRVLGVYLVLTLVITVIMQDFSPRHTLFLLVDAILLTAMEKLFDRPREYYKVLGYGMSVCCSLFIIRFLTPTVMKAWEVDTYFSFAFSVMNLFVLACALVSRGLYRGIVVLLGGTIVAIPVFLCWGFFASEYSWLNAEAVMAVMQTNPAEAMSYVVDRTGVAAAFLLVFVLAIMLVLWVRVTENLRLKPLSKGLAAGFVLLVVFNGVLMVRTHDNFLVSIYKETNNFQAEYDEFAKQCQKRQERLSNAIQLSDRGEDGIFVLVIGESQNRTRMSAYGYGLKTTPWLDSMRSDPNMLLFDKAYSCHVQTVPALAYALTAKNQYNDIPLEDAVSLIEVAKAAGYETVWLSNQVRYGSWGTPITVIAEAADQKVWVNSHQGDTLDTDYYDGELVSRLDSLKKSGRMLIVVHLMGSHTSYHSRYPAEFEEFRADGKASEYDNSLLYNDYVMENMLEKLREWPDFKGLVYFSDHSEGVNYGMGHNHSTFIYDMAYIPLYMYFTPAWQQTNADKMQNLRRETNAVFTNDLIFNTLLGVMGISSKALDEEQNDLTSAGYDARVERFKTLYGDRSVIEDEKATE